MASQAIEQQAFEASHDLAWRAVQLGPRNDPKLLLLLARTQSLSGRPHDALVMLRRLAGMGLRVEDAETSDDFVRVRELSEWPQLLSLIRGEPEAPSPPRELAPARRDPSSRSEPSPAANVARSIKPNVPAARSSGGLRVPASVLSPIALAYDAVSARFILADDGRDTLKVLDELAGNAVDLVGRRWAAPYRAIAMAIDTSRGDLWVAGVDDAAAGGPRSALHKLQLVSGRLLQTIPFPEAAGPTRITDVAIGRNTVFVLASLGRIFSLPAGTRSIQLHLAMTGFGEAACFALAGDNRMYVAHARGLARIDLEHRTTQPVAAAKANDILDLQSIAWHNGSIFGIQKVADGHVAVRIQMDPSGLIALTREVIEAAASPASALAGGVFYYLGLNGSGTGVVLRRSPVRTKN